MMKNINRVTLKLSTIFFIFSLSFCTKPPCKRCKTVTYENGVIINSSHETEYCGAALEKKESTPDVTTGALTTKVECK